MNNRTKGSTMTFFALKSFKTTGNKGADCKIVSKIMPFVDQNMFKMYLVQKFAKMYYVNREKKVRELLYYVNDISDSHFCGCSVDSIKILHQLYR